jgi:hypothetical protein
MEHIFDSKVQPLPAPEIIMYALKNQERQLQHPIYAEIAGIVKEMSLKTADTEQVGNTVYMGHKKKMEDGRLVMYGRGFNVDTGPNFVENGKKYMQLLQRKGVEVYVTPFVGPKLLSAFKVWRQWLQNQGAGDIGVEQQGANNYTAYIRLDPKPRIKV